MTFSRGWRNTGRVILLHLRDRISDLSVVHFTGVTDDTGRLFPSEDNRKVVKGTVASRPFLRMISVPAGIIATLLTVNPSSSIARAPSSETVSPQPTGFIVGANSPFIATAPSLQTARRSPAPAPPKQSVTRQRIGSAYYTLTLTLHPKLVPPPDRPRAGGSIAALGDGFLLVTAAGEFYRLSWESGADTLRSQRLQLSAPFNREELIAASGTDGANPFRITDLLVEDRGGDTVIYLSHHHWDNRARCVSLRVSRTVLSSRGSSDATGVWDTVFDSQPCLPLGEMWPRSGGADESGGRLARHPQGLLLTVGDHGVNGLDGMPPFAQIADTSYGKILLLDEAGAIVPFSIGHRNPQGLTIDSAGRIWESEHGPEGGDEINLIVRGGNYGWPLVTYGTDYRSDVWPLSPTSRNHGTFREPALAFVPSVGVSEILQVRSNYLPHWTGDLLLASLRAGVLYRVRTSGDAVVYTECIDVSMRVRDLAEGQDGRILIWGDDGQVSSLTLESPTYRVTDASRP